jgi:hypothetical protein
MTDAMASIAVVCRTSWTVLDRIALPCREVYDLVLAPIPLLEGVRRGFRTNSRRETEQDQYALFRQAGVEPVRLWATGDPLPPEARRVKVEASVPATMRLGSIIDITCMLENEAGAILISAPPYPVHLSYRWRWRESGSAVEGTEGLRTELKRSLPPGQTLKSSLKVQAPPTSGDYTLCVTLVQEHIAWFDDIARSNASYHDVRVLEIVPAAEASVEATPSPATECPMETTLSAAGMKDGGV